MEEILLARDAVGRLRALSRPDHRPGDPTITFALDGQQHEVFVPGQDPTAQDVARAINEQLGGVQAVATPAGGVSVSYAAELRGSVVQVGGRGNGKTKVSQALRRGWGP